MEKRSSGRKGTEERRNLQFIQLLKKKFKFRYNGTGRGNAADPGALFIKGELRDMRK